MGPQGPHGALAAVREVEDVLVGMEPLDLPPDGNERSTGGLLCGGGDWLALSATNVSLVRLGDSTM